jgi:hypothetical protein
MSSGNVGAISARRRDRLTDVGGDDSPTRTGSCHVIEADVRI